MPLTVLALALLLGVAAVVVDGGAVMRERRMVQAAADAAALAAAADLYAHYNSNNGTDPQGTALQSARTTASANGYDYKGALSTVTVRISPRTYLGGPNAGQALPAGYVEVTVQSTVSGLFSGAIGQGSVTVQGRSVARGTSAPSGDGVVLLNLQVSGALSISSQGKLDINGFPLRVNSSSASAISLSGQAQVTASQINLAVGGGISGSLLGLLGIGGGAATVSHESPIADPLRFLLPPDPTALGLAMRGTNLSISGGTINLYPGVYTGGINLSGAASVVLHANSDGSPGIYYLQGGGLSLSGQASISTSSTESAGVMLYNAWSSSSDAIQVGSQASLSLVPPASGPYRGLSLFQQRGTPASPGPTINLSGQGAVNLRGTVYAAYASTIITGQGSTNTYGGQFIVDQLSLQGLGTVSVDRGNFPVAGARVVGLVE
jgi:Flp pilus assembly protein TadG